MPAGDKTAPLERRERSVRATRPRRQHAIIRCEAPRPIPPPHVRLLHKFAVLQRTIRGSARRSVIRYSTLSRDSSARHDEETRTPLWPLRIDHERCQPVQHLDLYERWANVSDAAQRSRHYSPKILFFGSLLLRRWRPGLPSTSTRRCCRTRSPPAKAGAWAGSRSRSAKAGGFTSAMTRRVHRTGAARCRRSFHEQLART